MNIENRKCSITAPSISGLTIGIFLEKQMAREFSKNNFNQNFAHKSSQLCLVVHSCNFIDIHSSNALEHEFDQF